MRLHSPGLALWLRIFAFAETKAGNTAIDEYRGETTMWTKPKLVEIAVGTEINCYACADID
ncbi:hypothetical protein AA700_1615 [Acidiphilium acidophilum DSM 700]|nr:hypothetical protein AA700_1615 [Acidiphilium acidophilum DSM 700]